MSINLTIPNSETPQLKPRITVIGVGGAGGNAVNNMIEKQLQGVDFIVANTDAQALSLSQTDRRIQLGTNITQGLGAGSKPETGRSAAEESLAEIEEQIKDSDMVFIAAGMGGGTGTGAAPVVARAAKEKGILTVGVITKPFQFEGMHRYKLAEAGIDDLEQFVDTLIVIPNQNLFRVANEQTTFADAFNMADEVLYSGVRGVTDLMVKPGLINLDFADIRSVMSEMGKAMMGTGEGEGERRALDAAEAAISNPLLDDSSMAGAKAVLINITGGEDMTLFEADEAANKIRNEVDSDAYIIFGSGYDETLAGRLRVSVVATGMDREAMVAPAPTFLSVSSPVAAPVKQEATNKAEVPAPMPVMPAVAKARNVEISTEQPVIETPAAAVQEAPVEDVLESPVVEAEPEQVTAPQPEPTPVVEETIAQGEAAPATPGMNAEDAFIPEMPMSPTGEEAVQAADPYAAAAMTNGAKPSKSEMTEVKSQAKKQSLFERVTGLAGAAQSPAEAPVPFTPKALAPTPAPAPRPEEAQNKLGGLDETDRLPSAASEDDLLDIPAFLRRQAN